MDWSRGLAAKDGYQRGSDVQGGYENKDILTVIASDLSGLCWLCLCEAQIEQTDFILVFLCVGTKVASIWSAIWTRSVFWFSLLGLSGPATISISVFAAAELQRSLLHWSSGGQIEWKQDSPQGEPRLARRASFKGHSGTLERATRPLLNCSRGDGDSASRAD